MKCNFCRSEVKARATFYLGAPGGPAKLVDKDFCSRACRANAVLLLHIDIRLKRPASEVSYDILLGIKP